MTTRPTLPTNYDIDPGEDLETFQSIGDWTLGGTATSKSLDSDIVHFKSGTQSIKISGSAGSVTASKSIDVDLCGKEEMAVWVYVDDPTPSTSIESFRVLLSNDSSYTNLVVYVYEGSYFEHGWNVIKIGNRNGSFTGFKFDSNATRLRFDMRVASGQTSSVSVALFKVGIRSIPKILLTFDDGTAEQYTDAFVYMMERGLRGTLYLISNYLDAVGKISTAQVQTIYDAGFAIGNHSKDHVYGKVGGTYAEQLAEYQYARDFLISHGWVRGADHVAYPGNTMTSDTHDVFVSLGVKTARRVRYGNCANATDMLYMLPGIEPISVLNIIYHIERTISAGATLIIMIHDPDDLAGGVSTFTGLIDYLLTKAVDIVTIDEWYNGLINPRYRSLPVTRVVA